ncbi:MAG: 6,7-dimethyl-8-ribityllumazine synthase [bacterium]
MPRIIEGNLDAKGLGFAVVVSRFNDFITGKLMEGCLDGLARHGAEDDDISVIKVPGSFEMPVIVKKLARSGDYDAVIALGAIIRGSTPHFEYVAAEATKGIAQAMLETGVPVAFGVITSDTIEQAVERAGTKSGNKGYDAAMSAIEMCRVLRQL